MDVVVLPDKMALGVEAARRGGDAIRGALDAQGSATIVVATGASQFEVLANICADRSIDWSRVTAFHLDEYIGLPETHPASFRRYLLERFVVPSGGTVKFVPIDGSTLDPAAEAQRLGRLIKDRDIDVCLAGIGENCHLAFNDPGADFETNAPYIVVDLDEACRFQQFSEGWFTTIDDVPKTAITMSIRQILKARTLVVSVPDARKAGAVRYTIESEITPLHPATILRQHDNCTLLLEPASAALL